MLIANWHRGPSSFTHVSLEQVEIKESHQILLNEACIDLFKVLRCFCGTSGRSLGWGTLWNTILDVISPCSQRVTNNDGTLNRDANSVQKGTAGGLFLTKLCSHGLGEG